MKIRNGWLLLVVLLALAGGVYLAIPRGGDGRGKETAPANRVPDSSRQTAKPAKSDRAERGKSGRPRSESRSPAISRMLKEGERLGLTDEQLTQYLIDSRRSAESLLTASRLKNNLTYLREAAQAFPDHPLVQLELAMRGETPEEKRQALDRYRKLNPDNALGGYLSAWLLFQQGQTEPAIEEFAQANSRPSFSTGSEQSAQGIEDAYLSAGYSLAEAKCAALYGQPLSHLAPINQLASSLAVRHGQLSQAGDAEAAAKLLESGLQLSRRMSGLSKTLINGMVALSVESRFLRLLPPDSVVPGSNETAAARLAAIDAERQEIRALTSKTKELQAGMTDNQLLAYLKRVEQDGERDALLWLETQAQP